MQNPFELITDDHVILGMCKQWDNTTLLNMSRAYRRVNFVCRSVIKKRKKEYLEKILTELGLNLDLINLLLPFIPYDEGVIDFSYDKIEGLVDEKQYKVDLETFRKFDPYIPKFYGIKDIANSILNLLDSNIFIRKDFWITDSQKIGRENFEQRLLFKRGEKLIKDLIIRLSRLNEDKTIQAIRVKGSIQKIPAIRVFYVGEKEPEESPVEEEESLSEEETLSDEEEALSRSSPEESEDELDRDYFLL